MVAAAEVGADLYQRQARQLAGQVHADLPRHQYAAVAPFRLQLPRLHLEIAADALGDALHRDAAGVGLFAEVLGHRRHVRGRAALPQQRLQPR